MTQVTEARKRDWHLDLWKTSPEVLKAYVGDKPAVVVFARGFNSLVPQTNWIKGNMPHRVIWCRQEDSGVSLPHGYIASGFAGIKDWIEQYRGGTGEDVWFVVTFMATNHTYPWWLKKWFPRCRVLCHFYDVMNLWVPTAMRHLWDDYELTKGSNPAEYISLEEVLTGKYVDGYLYKDWGPGWPFLTSTGRPCVWCPSVTSRELFQEPGPPNAVDKFIFIGTLVPKSTHGGIKGTSGIFSDIMMEDVFDLGVRQGYEIHAYVSQWDDLMMNEVIPEYRKRFPYGNVRIFNGAFLQGLLPRCKGRYKWGWMMYHFPQPAIMGIVENTLPTKLFTYWALGVPPVVSEEFEAVARVVEETGTGVIVSQGEMTRLSTILPKVDYKKMTGRIKEVREAYSVERFSDSLGRLIYQSSFHPPAVAPDDVTWREDDNRFFAKCVATWKQKGYLRDTAWRDTRGMSSLGSLQGPAPYG